MSAQQPPDRLGRWLAIAASVVVAATLVAAVWMMGSPSTQREANLDGRRVGDLSQIARLLDDHLLTHDALPPDLATLAEEPGRRLSTDVPSVRGVCHRHLQDRSRCRAVACAGVGPRRGPALFRPQGEGPVGRLKSAGHPAQERVQSGLPGRPEKRTKIVNCDEQKKGRSAPPSPLIKPGSEIVPGPILLSQRFQILHQVTLLPGSKP